MGIKGGFPQYFIPCSERMNTSSSCLNFTSAWITGVQCHAWYTWCCSWNRSFVHARRLPTESHSNPLSTLFPLTTAPRLHEAPNQPHPRKLQRYPKPIQAYSDSTRPKRANPRLQLCLALSSPTDDTKLKLDSIHSTHLPHSKSN